MFIFKIYPYHSLVNNIYTHVDPFMQGWNMTEVSTSILKYFIVPRRIFEICAQVLIQAES